MDVTFEGRKFSGQRDELIILFRGMRLSYREIGKLVGCSPTTVGTVLNSEGISGHMQYPELDDPNTFTEKSDAAIAKDLRLRKSRVRASRFRTLEIGGGVKSISLDKRRVFLTTTLFGCLPGPKFVDFFISHLDAGLLPPKQSQLIRDFYIDGCGPDTPYTRFYRSYARDRLKEKVVEWSVETLIDTEVLSVRTG